jgi:hypothetical protein
MGVRLGRRRGLAHDHRPRRVDRVGWDDLPRLSFLATAAGELDVALVPNLGAVYVATLPADVAAVMLPALDAAARSLVPLVAEDGDLGPLKGLCWW